MMQRFEFQVHFNVRQRGGTVFDQAVKQTISFGELDGMNDDNGFSTVER